MTLPFSYHELIETFPQHGCALCNLLRDKLGRYLDHLLYERVTQPATDKAFRAAQGLCAVHGDLLLSVTGSALGISILYRASLTPVLDRLEAELTRPGLRPGRRQGQTTAADLYPTGGCPACIHMLEIEQRLIGTLLDFAGDTRLLEAYRQSDGICLPHLHQFMALGASGEDRDQFLNIQAEHWQTLLAELEVFIQKQDYRRGQEEFGEERDSWRRAVRLVSGDPVVFGMRRSAPERNDGLR